MRKTFDVFKKKGMGLADRANDGLLVAGRMKHGLAAAAVQARLDAIASALECENPEVNKNRPSGLPALDCARAAASNVEGRRVAGRKTRRYEKIEFVTARRSIADTRTVSIPSAA